MQERRSDVRARCEVGAVVETTDGEVVFRGTCFDVSERGFCVQSLESVQEITTEPLFVTIGNRLTGITALAQLAWSDGLTHGFQAVAMMPYQRKKLRGLVASLSQS